MPCGSSSGEPLQVMRTSLADEAIDGIDQERLCCKSHPWGFFRSTGKGTPRPRAPIDEDRCRVSRLHPEDTPPAAEVGSILWGNRGSPCA